MNIYYLYNQKRWGTDSCLPTVLESFGSVCAPIYPSPQPVRWAGHELHPQTHSTADCCTDRHLVYGQPPHPPALASWQPGALAGGQVHCPSGFQTGRRAGQESCQSTAIMRKHLSWRPVEKRRRGLQVGKVQEHKEKGLGAGERVRRSKGMGPVSTSGKAFCFFLSLHSVIFYSNVSLCKISNLQQRWKNRTNIYVFFT